MTDTAALFWNSFLYDNLVLAYFLGVLLILVETKDLKSSYSRGLKFAGILIGSTIIGWLGYAALGSELSTFAPVVFFITTMIGVAVLRYWGELEGEWLGFPRYIVALGVLFGKQWLVFENSLGYAEMLTFALGSAAGFYLVFVLISAIREQILISESAPQFKRYSTLLATLGVLGLGLIGFHVL